MMLTGWGKIQEMVHVFGQMSDECYNYQIFYQMENHDLKPHYIWVSVCSSHFDLFQKVLPLVIGKTTNINYIKIIQFRNMQDICVDLYWKTFERSHKFGRFKNKCQKILVVKGMHRRQYKVKFVRYFLLEVVIDSGQFL